MSSILCCLHLATAIPPAYVYPASYPVPVDPALPADYAIDPVDPAPSTAYTIAYLAAYSPVPVGVDLVD